MLTTAVKTRRRITVTAVREVLEEIARDYPWRQDRRVTDERPVRYVDFGQPSCLVAHVLIRLGYSVGVLRALDAEHRTGELFRAGGVKVAESRHPALRRIDPTARRLLQYVQDQQDRGEAWGRIVAAAFRPSRFFPRLDRERRPWLCA